MAGSPPFPPSWLTSSTRWPPEWDIFEIIDDVIFGYPHPIERGKCAFVEGAAGGDWPGDPDNSTPFHGEMEVDYVRVYQD